MVLLSSVLFLLCIAQRASTVQSGTFSEGTMRLRRGRTQLDGIAELYIQGAWGKLLDPDWTYEDAVVACKQLGFQSPIRTIRSNCSNYETDPSEAGCGKIHGSTHTLEVQCRGNESSLLECAHNSTARDFFGKESITPIKLSCAVERSVQLVTPTDDSEDSCRMGEGEGIVKVLEKDSWLSLCSDRWSKNEATVACRELGFLQSEGFTLVAQDSNVSNFAFNCTGSEFTLRSCSFVLQECTAKKGIQLHCSAFPQPTEILLVDKSCSSLLITWKPQNNTVYNAVRYKPVEAASWLQQPTEILSSGTSVLLGDLKANMLYEVQLISNNEVDSFSNVLIAQTSPSKIEAPSNVAVINVDFQSVTVSWNFHQPCDDNTIGFQLAIEQSNDSDFQFTTFIPYYDEDTVDEVYFYHLESLSSLTYYKLWLATVVDVHTTECGNCTILTEYSNAIEFKTQEGVPSSPPQSISAFVDTVQSAAILQWQPINEDQNNMLSSVYHYLLSCWYTSDGEQQSLEVTTDAMTYHINSLVPGVEYKCTVSAISNAGSGPSSVPVVFYTPPNTRPRPPTGVYFEIDLEDAESTIPQRTFVKATWDVHHCTDNISICSEVLGYMTTCRHEGGGEGLKEFIWQSDIDNQTVGTAYLSAEDNQGYTCSIAALNSHGFGFPGSIIYLHTPEAEPKTKPEDLYSSSVTEQSVFIHWSYEENPSPGTLLGFQLELYMADSRYPERDGQFIEEKLYRVASTFTNRYSYAVESLSPGVRYNILVAAVTSAGTGPSAKVLFQTITAAPSFQPIDVSANLLLQQENFFVYSFHWEVPELAKSEKASLLGFIVDCSINDSSHVQQLISSISHTMFTRAVTDTFSEDIAIASTCQMNGRKYFCHVNAFNEAGDGPKSTEIVLNVPCPKNGNSLSQTFFGQPTYSLSFFVTSLFLIIALLFAVAVLVCFLASRKKRQRENRDLLNPYSSIDLYDENYMSMAPSTTNTADTYCSFPENVNSSGAAPRTQTRRTCSGAISEVSEEIYDEISDGEENIYDEIIPRSTSTNETILEVTTAQPSIGILVPTSQCGNNDFRCSHDYVDMEMALSTTNSNSPNYCNVALHKRDASTAETESGPDRRSDITSLYVPMMFSDVPSMLACNTGATVAQQHSLASAIRCKHVPTIVVTDTTLEQ